MAAPVHFIEQALSSSPFLVVSSFIPDSSLSNVQKMEQLEPSGSFSYSLEKILFYILVRLEVSALAKKHSTMFNVVLNGTVAKFHHFCLLLG